MENKMFGFNGFNNNSENQWYEKFDWKSFNGTTLLFRPILSFNLKWFDVAYLHSINNKFYLHENGCNLCNILNSDEKYTKLQEKLIGLKVPHEYAKEKWGKVIQNFTAVYFVGLMSNNPKPVLFILYNQLAQSFLNLTVSKNIESNKYCDFENGSAIQLKFVNMQKFPYRNLADIRIGKPQKLSDEIVTKIKDLPSFKSPFPNLSEDDANDVIKNWYTEGRNFYKTWKQKTVNSQNIVDDSIDDSFADQLKNTINKDLNNNGDIDFDLNNDIDDMNDDNSGDIKPDEEDIPF